MDKQAALRRAAAAHSAFIRAELAARRASEERRRALLQALATGASKAELARTLGLDPSTISRLTNPGRWARRRTR